MHRAIYITPSWKTLTCRSNYMVNKLRYVCTTEYFTTKRINKLQLPATIWINLTNLKKKEFIFYDSSGVKFMNKQKQFTAFGVRMVATSHPSWQEATGAAGSW